MRTRSVSVAALTLAVGFGYGAYAAEGVFDSNGVKLRYLVEGKGEPVVLLHGFSVPSAEAMWVKNVFAEPKVLPTLAKEFRVIALECRGHGQSGKPHDPRAYGTEMVEDVVRLLDHLKIDKAHVVGYSMGAMIAGKLLVDHPDRLRSVTFGGGAPIFAPSKEFKAVLDATAESLDKGEGIGPLLRAVTPLGQPNATPEQFALTGKLLVAGQDQKALASAIRSFLKLEVTADQLAANKVPVAFVYGSKESGNLVRMIDAARAHLKGSSVTVVEGGDHIGTPPLPAFHRAIMTFLRANSGKGR